MADFKIIETKLPSMMTVSQAVGVINQPRGGYINPKDLEETAFEGDPIIDLSQENIHSSLIGLSVDYLSRYLLTKDKENSFDIPLKGVMALQHYAYDIRLGMEYDFSNSYDLLDEEIAFTNYQEMYRKLLDNLDTELSDLCIASAAKLSGFDVAYRRGPEYFVGVDQIEPDDTTIEHIRQLTKRTVNMLKKYGKLVDAGFDFPKAYTRRIINADADYLTEDTLWDLKVIKGKFGKGHIMQLLLYWRLGMKDSPKKFSKVKYIGIISPRHNKAYRYELSQIPQEFIDFLDYKVIGYKQK